MSNDPNLNELFNKVMEVLIQSEEFPGHKEYLDGICLLGGVTEKRQLKAMSKRLNWEISMAWITPEQALEAISSGNYQIVAASAKKAIELKQLRKKFCESFNLNNQ